MLPVGFARIGIKPHRTPEVIRVGMEKWHVCYHGTKWAYLDSIVKHGFLIKPGESLLDGSKISVSGHNTTSFRRTNEHTQKQEDFDPRTKLFSSPSAAYCSYGKVYMDERKFQGGTYVAGLTIRLQPGTYAIGQETVSAGSTNIDQHVPNSSVEWYTESANSHFFTGVIIREVPPKIH